MNKKLHDEILPIVKIIIYKEFILDNVEVD